MTSLQARTGAIVITGAAGGLGGAIAHELAGCGRPMVLCDLHAAPLEQLAEELRATTPIDVVAGDITSPALHRRLFVADRELAAFVHAAGVSPTMADGERVFAINFTATVALVEAALPHLAAGGVAVLIASNSGQLVAGWPADVVVDKIARGQLRWLRTLVCRNPQLAYPISKRAVQLYAARMAPAFGARGARIVSLSPGMIDTQMGRQERAASASMDKMLAATPTRRFGDSREIAATTAFLVSAGASYITGTDILVDGGTVAGIAAAGGVRKALA